MHFVDLISPSFHSTVERYRKLISLENLNYFQTPLLRTGIETQCIFRFLPTIELSAVFSIEKEKENALFRCRTDCTEKMK